MKKNNLTGVLVLLVFAIFAVSALLVLLTGADLVQGMARRDQRSYDQRTAIQYLTTRIRQADQAGAVFAADDGTLVLLENIDGTLYETRVYCHEGYLREMFCESGYTLAPEFGEEILPMTDLMVSWDESFVHLCLEMPDSTEVSLFLHLRSEQEVAR